MSYSLNAIKPSPPAFPAVEAPPANVSPVAAVQVPVPVAVTMPNASKDAFIPQTCTSTALLSAPAVALPTAKPCNNQQDYNKAFWQGAASPITHIFASKANMLKSAGVGAMGVGLMVLNRPLAEKIALPLSWGIGAVQVVMGAKAYFGARNEKERCASMEGVGLAVSGLGLAALPSLMKSLEHKLGQNKGLGPLASLATLLVLIDPLLDLLCLNTLFNKKEK